MTQQTIIEVIKPALVDLQNGMKAALVTMIQSKRSAESVIAYENAKAVYTAERDRLFAVNA